MELNCVARIWIGRMPLCLLVALLSVVPLPATAAENIAVQFLTMDSKVERVNLEAKYSLGLVEDPNTRDTLACLYASEGRYSLAVHEEEISVSEGSTPDYIARLKLFKHHKAFREAHEPAELNLEFTP